MAGQYVGKLSTVVGVFHAILPAQMTFHPYTETRPTISSGFVFIIRGQGAFTFNDTTYELHPGTVVHGGKQMSLTMRTDASELEYVLVRYTLQDVGTTDPPTHHAVADAHFMLEPGTNPTIAELLSQLSESFYTSGNMALLQTNYLFQLLLHELFAACLNRQNGNSKEVIEQARSYIHANYMKPLNLGHLAGRHGMKVKSFSYLFHKYTGVFPIDYLIQHRMKRAQELLTMSNCSIKQVAASVGYEDALYFSRLYKKYYGIAPSHRHEIGK